MIAIWTRRLALLIAVIGLSVPFHHVLAAGPAKSSIGFVKGYSWGWPGYRGEYLGAAPERSLERLAATGTRWIALSFAAHVASKQSTEIDFGAANGSMVSDEEIHRAIGLARARGMKIMLKPMINSRDGAWRAEIRFASDKDWDAWWNHYEAFLLHYAKIAADAKCEMLCVGCEMRSMEPFADRWRQVIAKTRRIYSGLIVYDANHDDVDKVEWFDAVDVIGVSAYYPVASAGDASLDRMLDGWKPVRTRLRQISRRWDKPVLFAEIGVRSAKGCSATPWDAGRDDRPYDGEEQARFYEAAFQSFAREPWFLGFFWWDWPARMRDRNEGPGRTDFHVFGKPAEEVLRRWYSKAL
ncbi:MAG: hypothetical protein JW719_07115 [Pirellulales bacterium]|nr:hypothetical protein [Pirellulales bacterium]